MRALEHKICTAPGLLIVTQITTKGEVYEWNNQDNHDANFGVANNVQGVGEVA
jgi:hypothetical protein